MVLYCKTRCLESCNDHCSKDIGYKIGDTFLYKKENCYMIFMYMKGDPCADTILFKDELAIQSPLHVLQYESRNGSKIR